MSSDSDSASSRGGAFKNFRHITRDRLLNEMLKSNSGDSKSWKVFIMDKVTLKIMSSSCNMSDVTAEGISLVEDLFRRRQPMPSMDAIYFIQPSKENVILFMSDMSGREPLYRKAFVYFSTPVSKDLVNHIKKDVTVVPRIGALREMNLEFFPVDGQVFVTDHDMASEELYGESAKNLRKFDACLNTMATRIATVFASLKELPHVRYQAPKNLDSASSGDLVPSKLATAVWDHIKKYKTDIPNFPQKETCELLILDRSVDQIAPVIHEWTYDAMCHDLLETDGNKLVLEVNNKSSGLRERKEIFLEDSDPVWLEIRHMHIAEASERLYDKMASFASKNKAAQLSQALRDGAELSTTDLQRIVEALPEYTEHVAKLSLHVEVAGKINNIIRDMGLRDLGKLEQDIVFGDAGTKELITFLRANQDASVENKLRLLMIYASVHPDKFEGDKASQLMQLAKLSSENMKAIKNMRMLAASSISQKKSSGSFSLTFDRQRKKVAVRKDRTNDEANTWALSKFYPLVEELIENIDKNELSKSDYNLLNEPSPGINVGNQSTGTTVHTATTAGLRTGKSRRTTTWARTQHSDDGSSDSMLGHASSDFKVSGSRIFIFIIGGATRSEIRACYKLTTKLKREIILGTTGIDDPPQYITKLKLLSEDFSLDDLTI